MNKVRDGQKIPYTVTFRYKANDSLQRMSTCSLNFAKAAKVIKYFPNFKSTVADLFKDRKFGKINMQFTFFAKQISDHKTGSGP